VPIAFATPAIVTSEPIMDPSAARLTADVLADGRARRDAFGADLAKLFGPGRFALKTGTSSNWRDAWCAAFTDEITVVVWLGDPAGAPMQSVSGFEGASRPAVRILALAQERARALDLPVRDETPPLLATARICAQSGLLAGPRCPHAIEERFAIGSVPEQTCEVHDPQGRWLLSERYARWLELAHPGETALAPPPRGAIAIAHPENGARWLIDPSHPTPSIPLRATVSGDQARAQWLIDDQPIEGDHWTPTLGHHVVAAMLGTERSAPVEVDVVGP